MRTMFHMGFSGDPFWMAQAALAKADRDRILADITRADAEADEIDAWARLNQIDVLPAELKFGYTPTALSPYYLDYVKAGYQWRPLADGLKKRLSQDDPSTWSAPSSQEQAAYDGWVKQADATYKLFKENPDILKQGHWKGYQPEPKPAEKAQAPAPEQAPLPVAFPLSAGLVVGGVTGAGLIAALAGRSPWLRQVPLVLGPSSWGGMPLKGAPFGYEGVPPYFGQWGVVDKGSGGYMKSSGQVGPYPTIDEAFKAAGEAAHEHGAELLPTDGFAQVVDSRGQPVGPVT